MSGGSWNYLHQDIEDAARRLVHGAHSSCVEERVALGRLLEKVARAMHDIEWVDSCDYGKGDEREAILACVGSLDAAAEAAADRLAAEIDRAQAILKTIAEAQ